MPTIQQLVRKGRVVLVQLLFVSLFKSLAEKRLNVLLNLFLECFLVKSRLASCH